MTYDVNFTEPNNPSKLKITVQDQTLETTRTSLSFVGKNYAGYAQPMAENFLHLLENFANNSSPTHPVQGQLWFDTTDDSIKVYDSISWVPVGGVKRGASTPTSNTVGDLWVNTAKSQLNLFNGTNWLLIGPQYSEGSRSGPEVETIVDINNQSHTIITLFCESYRVAVVSSVAFIPKSSIVGFSKINQGITLSSFDFSSTNVASLTKFWGRASEADALNINGNTVSSTYFLRSDVSSTTNKSLNVRDDSGISIGSNLNFNISTTSTETLLTSNTTGKNVKIKLTGSQILPGSLSQTLMYTAINIDSSGKIGFGVDNIIGESSGVVDVKVSNTATYPGIRTDGRLLVENSTNSSSKITGSIVTAGGLGVGLKSNFGDSITVNGTITVGDSTAAAGAVLIPSITETHDIGTSSNKFRKVYADTFYGNIVGNLTVTDGLVTGDVTGYAGRLKDSTNFSITGDVVTTSSISFNGTQGTVQFNTRLSDTYYTGTTAATSLQSNDVLFLNRSGETRLRQISKTNFVNSMPVVPVGSIFPFAGTTPPNGYLFCDGSEILISNYVSLYNAIGFTYKESALLQGRSTFALPDLRGRFPLGRDNMNNGITVPSKDSTEENPVYISTVSNAANRVSSATASLVGGQYPSSVTATAQGGIDTRKLNVENLPSHKHSLKSSDGTRYYAVNPGGDTQPPDLGGYVGQIHEIGDSAQLIPVTGDIDTTISQLQQPFNIMNPYLTINYIIFTGVLS